MPLRIGFFTKTSFHKNFINGLKNATSDASEETDIVTDIQLLTIPSTDEFFEVDSN